MQDAATNCKCMRLASLPSNSVTAASLAHMRAHMASSIHGGCARFSTTFVNSPKPRDSVGLRWGPCEVPLALQLLKFSWKGGFFLFFLKHWRGGLLSHYCGIIVSPALCFSAVHLFRLLLLSQMVLDAICSLDAQLKHHVQYR